MIAQDDTDEGFTGENIITIIGRDGKTYTYWSRDSADLVGD